MVWLSLCSTAFIFKDCILLITWLYSDSQIVQTFSSSHNIEALLIPFCFKLGIRFIQNCWKPPNESEQSFSPVTDGWLNVVSLCLVLHFFAASINHGNNKVLLILDARQNWSKCGSNCWQNTCIKRIFFFCSFGNFQCSPEQFARKDLVNFRVFQQCWSSLSVRCELAERAIFTATTEKCQLSSVLLVE